MKLKSTRRFFRDNHLQLATEVEPPAKKMQKEDVRPHRPLDLSKSRWILGDIIEVFYRNLWRPGKIMKVLKNDYFVIGLTCCIQFKEFHISCLRVPQAYHSKQSTVMDKVTDISKPTRLAHHTSPRSNFVIEQDDQACEEYDHMTKRHKLSKLCPSTSARVVKRKPESRRIPPDELVRRRCEKRKVAAYEICQPSKKVLPLKVSARNDIDGDHLYRPFSDRHNNLAQNNFTTKTKPDCEVLHSSQIPLHVREENECSVASCSANCLEYFINNDHQPVGLGSCFPDDAMSACPAGSWWKNNNAYGPSSDMNVHDLELQAYQSTVRALYASGPLTWEQELLLTNLRLSLNISNEEHLLQLRRLLSS